jgi:hypothetical protein
MAEKGSGGAWLESGGIISGDGKPRTLFREHFSMPLSFS